MTGDSFQIGFVSQLMSREQTRHRVISQNIANVNTVGYHARDVDFETALNDVTAGRASGQHLSSHRIVEKQGLMVREDGNNVDIDRELGNLDKTALTFNTYAQILSGKLAMLRLAIGGR